MVVGVASVALSWAGGGCSSATGAVMVLIVDSALALLYLIVVIVFSVIVTSSIIRVCLVSYPLISLSALVRTLFSVVGRGTNLSLCSSL